MRFVCSQRSTYHVNLEKVIWMPSSVMKIMHGLHLWLQTTPCNQTTKSDLMGCLEALVPQPDVVPSVNVKIVDGALLVHKLYLRKASIHTKTFQDYAQWVFLPYTEHILQDVARVYIVWDVYREDDLKAQTQQNHGAGSEICVANNTSVPANWNNNLHIDTNMDGLLKLLANAAQEFESPQEKQIISTHGRMLYQLPCPTCLTCGVRIKKGQTIRGPCFTNKLSWVF